jgi:hypothetical protein
VNDSNRRVTRWGCSASPTSKRHAAVGSDAFTCILTYPSNVRADSIDESAPTFTRMFGLAGGETWCVVERFTCPTGPCARDHLLTCCAAEVSAVRPTYHGLFSTWTEAEVYEQPASLYPVTVKLYGVFCLSAKTVIDSLFDDVWSTVA